MLKLETLLVTIFGLFIAFSIIAVFIMCVVGCIQYRKRKQGQRPHQTNRGVLSQPRRDMDTQNPPSEQDHDEENGEAYRARDLSQAPPPAYRNAKQYLNVDLEHTEVIQLTAMYRISTHSMEPEESNPSPPQYTSVGNDSEVHSFEILNSSVVYPQEMQEDRLPPPYGTTH